MYNLSFSHLLLTCEGRLLCYFYLLYFFAYLFLHFIFASFGLEFLDLVSRTDPNMTKYSVSWLRVETLCHISNSDDHFVPKWYFCEFDLYFIFFVVFYPGHRLELWSTGCNFPKLFLFSTVKSSRLSLFFLFCIHFTI